MNVVKTQNGSELLMEIEGGIDTTTAPELNEILSNSLDNIDSLILDFKKVDYISSAGLRVLLVTFKDMSKKGGMIIRHVNENDRDIYEKSGVVKILTGAAYEL